jgi:hypothetical protein
LEFFELRPVGGLITRQVSVDRVNAEREELLEGRATRALTENIAADEVPIEGLEVPDVEEQPVSLGDGPLEEPGWGEESKEPIGPGPRLAEALRDRLANGGVWRGHGAQ